MPSTEYWDRSWEASEHDAKSWYQDVPEPSLEFVLACTPEGGSVVDVGGGASRLVDHLLTSGLSDLTVVDVSDVGMRHARQRLGERAQLVSWVVADVTELDLGRAVDTWHDRAVLHFLLDEVDRARYVEAVRRHVEPGGHVILATFAPDGPEACSGLPVRRHDVADLSALLGEDFQLSEHRRVEHVTPRDAIQPFTFAVFQRRAAS